MLIISQVKFLKNLRKFIGLVAERFISQQLGEISRDFGFKSQQPAGRGIFEGNRFGIPRRGESPPCRRTLNEIAASLTGIKNAHKGLLGDLHLADRLHSFFAPLLSIKHLNFA